MKPSAVIEDGPVGFLSNLQLEKIHQRLIAASIPACLSFHAGTHLCNQMLYSTCYLSEKLSLNTLSGFVHVPQSTDNVASSIDQAAICSSMTIPMMTQALTITIDCAVEQLNDASKNYWIS